MVRETVRSINHPVSEITHTQVILCSTFVYLNFGKLKKFLNCLGQRVEDLEQFGIYHETYLRSMRMKKVDVSRLDARA